MASMNKPGSIGVGIAIGAAIGAAMGTCASQDKTDKDHEENLD